MNSKLLNIVILACVFIINSTSLCLASEWIHDNSVLNDMNKNPSEYYFLYSSGSGLSDYLDIKSFNVELYNPPIYIISFKQVEYSLGYRGEVNIFFTHSRYKYDYTSRKVYFEKTVNNKLEWTEIEHWKMKDAADLIFAIAYNMHFYDKYDKNQLADSYLSGNKIVYIRY